MSYRVDALMEAVEVPGPYASPYGAFAQSGFEELPCCDDSVLSSGKLGSVLVRRGDFPTHAVGKSPHAGGRPPR